MRKAAFHLLESLYYRTEVIDLNKLVDAVVNGLSDTAEDALVLTMNILAKLSSRSCVVVLSRMDGIIAAFTKLFTSNLKLVSGA